MAQPRPSLPQQQQQQQLVPPPHQVIATQAHGQARLAQFHAPTSDVDAAMARAMLAVISSSDQPRRPCGALETYHGASTAAQPDTTGAAAQLVRQGQGMIKSRDFSVDLRETRAAPPEGTGRQLSSSNQRNHVMSERKRREKLNESFDALRGTLPPGTKKDKASVLASARDVVKSLRAEISELEGKNRSMEARLPQLHQPAVDGSGGDDVDPAAGEMVGVLIKIDNPGPAHRTYSSSTFPRQIQLRVAAPVELCGVTGLVLHILECLKKVIMVRGAVVELVSLEAGVHGGRLQMSPIAGGRAIVTMQIEVGDWDEDSFKQSIARAVQEAATTSSRRSETAAAPP